MLFFEPVSLKRLYMMFPVATNNRPAIGRCVGPAKKNSVNTAVPNEYANVGTIALVIEDNGYSSN